MQHGGDDDDDALTLAVDGEERALAAAAVHEVARHLLVYMIS